MQPSYSSPDPVLNLLNPTRPIDTRWQVARDLTHRRVAPDAYERDAWVERAVAYLTALPACRATAGRQRLYEAMPDVHAAVELHQRDPSHARSFLEARLLARQDIAEAAEACGVSSAAVEAYGRLFFDVAGRLDDERFIRKHVLTSRRWHGLKPAEADVAIRRVGYLEGPADLDLLQRFYASGWPLPSRLEGLTRKNLDDLHRLLRVRKLMLSWVEPEAKRPLLLMAELALDELKRALGGPPADGTGNPGSRPVNWGPTERRLIEEAGLLDPEYHGSHRKRRRGRGLLQMEQNMDGLFRSPSVDESQEEEELPDDTGVPPAPPRQEPLWLRHEPRSASLLLGPEVSDRPLNARWQLALAAARRQPQLAKDPSPWVARCTAYLKALLACDGDADRERLARDMPGLHAAVQLHAAGDMVACGELEGRLLSRQPFPGVAAACGLTLEAVEAFHDLFFDVRGRLDANAFICVNALGEKHFHGLTEHDADVFLRWIGYTKGPPLLDWFVEYYRRGLYVPQTLDKVGREELEKVCRLLNVRAVILARVLPLKQMHRVNLLEQLIEQLQTHIDALPTGRAGRRVGDVATGPLLASPEVWSAWRSQVHAAYTCEGGKRRRKAKGAA